MLEELLDNREKQMYYLMEILRKNPNGLTSKDICVSLNKTRKTIVKYLNEIEEVLDSYPGIFLSKNESLYCIEKETYINIRDIYSDFFMISRKKIIVEYLFKGENIGQIISRVRLNHWSYSASRVSFLEIEEFFNRLNIDLKTLNNKIDVETEIYYRFFFYMIQSSFFRNRWIFNYAREDQVTKLVLKIEKKLKITLSQEEKIRIGYMIAIANERLELGFELKEPSILFEFMNHKRNARYKKFKDCLSNSSFYKLSETQEVTILYNFFCFCFPEFYDQDISIQINENKKYAELLSYEKTNKKILLYTFILPGDFYKFLPASYYSERLMQKIVEWLKEKKYAVKNKEKTAFSLLELSKYDDQLIIKIYIVTNFERTMEDQFVELLCFYYPFQLKRVSSQSQADILISNIESVSYYNRWVIAAVPTMEEIKKELVPLLENEFFKKLAKIDYLKRD